MFPGCRGHTQLQQRLRRSCIFPTLLSPHKYAVLKRDYRVGVRAEGFIWTVSAVNRRLILAIFHRRQRRGLAGPVAGEATALKLVGIVIGFTVRAHTPEHPHERLRRKQVHLHELFWPWPEHLLSQGHCDGDRLRRSNRNSDLKQSLVISVLLGNFRLVGKPHLTLGAGFP